MFNKIYKQHIFQGLSVWLFLLLLVYLFGFFCYWFSYILFKYSFFLPRAWLPEVTAAEKKCIAS